MAGRVRDWKSILTNLLAQWASHFLLAQWTQFAPRYLLGPPGGKVIFCFSDWDWLSSCIVYFLWVHVESTCSLISCQHCVLLRRHSTNSGMPWVLPHCLPPCWGLLVRVNYRPQVFLPSKSIQSYAPFPDLTRKCLISFFPSRLNHHHIQ